MDNNIERIEHPKWHVINSFIDTWPFRDVFFTIFRWICESVITYDYRISAESLFTQPEINEPPPVYAAFNHEEYKSDAERMYRQSLVVHMR